jgi:hypothetical protein
VRQINYYILLLLSALSLPVIALETVLETLPTHYATMQFVGDAYAVDSGEQLYSEHHVIKVDSTGRYITSNVEYRDPDNKVFATKHLDFNGALTKPELSFNDLRSGNMIKTRNILNGDEHFVAVELHNGQEVEVTMLSSSERSAPVTDAGFDQFVETHWQALVNGDTLELDFLALSRATYIGFTLEKTSDEGDLMKLRLAPASFLIRLLMDPIYLTYDRVTRKLLVFEGLTNIDRVVEGRELSDHYVARIEYRYSAPESDGPLP